jgi:tRNA(Ile)-lysidine synthase
MVAITQLRAALETATAIAGLSRPRIVLIAYSGGLDSTVLLHAAAQVFGAAQCCAAHIHHGLSPHADAWQEHCAQFAHTLGCAFITRRIDLTGAAVPVLNAVRGDPGVLASGLARDAASTSIEACARHARYRALQEIYREHNAQALLLGHHADDQAETVLLQLLRGAGVAGLAAMPAATDDHYGMRRMRPWLDVPRALLVAYARHYQLTWIEDESNLDTRYTRNLIRHTLSPILEHHFPAYRTALARSARHAAQAQSVLDDMAQLDLQRAATDAQCSSLSHARFAALSVPRATNLLRYWIRMMGLPAVSAAQLDEALRQLRSATSGTVVRIAPRAHLCIYRDVMSWEFDTLPLREQRNTRRQEQPAQTDAQPRSAQFVWPGGSIWHLPQWGGSFVLRTVACRTSSSVPVSWFDAFVITARARAGGERMRIAVNRPHRSLKQLFQEGGVPVWQRAVPLLYADDVLLWVPRLGLNKDVFAMAAARGLSVAEERWLEIDWVGDE